MSPQPSLKGDIVEWRWEEEKEKWSFELCLSGLGVGRRCPLNHQWDKQTWPAAVWHWHHLCRTTYLLLFHLCFVIFSTSFCFSSGTVLCCVLFYSVLLWSIFFSGTVLCLILLFAVLLYCPQLNKGNMSLYWQLLLCVRLRPRRFLSRGSFRNRNTELKVRADEYSTGKNRQAGRGKNVDFNNRQPHGNVLQSIHPQARGSACVLPPQRFSS